jgi:hypothetical protein
MPDLITHLAFSHLLIRGYEWIKKVPAFTPFRVLFYLGTLLPDVVTRPFYILLPATYDWTAALHTPIGAFTLSGLITLFFAPSIRRKTFLFLSIGCMSHFLLDAFQTQLIYNNYWFFPFSWKSVGWGITGAGIILEWIPVWILIVLSVEGTVWIKHKNQETRIKNQEKNE